MFIENDLKKSILIVDDEAVVRNVLSQVLSENYECVEAASAEEALDLLKTETFNLVISDIKMTGISGLQMIPQVRELAPDTIVIMISGEQSIENAIKAMRGGAFDYITKPFTFDQIEAVVSRAVEHQSLRLSKKLHENHLEELVTARTAELREQIIERQRAEEKVNRMSYYDSLTDLPNPTLFKDRVTHELFSSSGSGQTSAIILLAVDRFKDINDTLGHEIGNELLCEMAQRLTNSIRQTDTAAYFGGAEFALYLTKIGGAEDAVKITQNINDALLLPFNCGENEIYVTASTGISMSPNDGADCQTLLQKAGTALSRTLPKGGDGCRFFTSDMHEFAVKRLSLENKLRQALERDEFILHYQPQVNARSGKFTGMEVLVRWLHPQLGLVPPNDFIPIAEETGLIIPLGEKVLRTACRQNAAWHRAGLSSLTVSVNLSLRQFQQPDLVEKVNQILVETGLEPEYLELELTESLIMNDAERTIEMLNRLKRLGIKISLDDFGTGHSSLSYLKTLPLDVLKIDRAFVRNIANDPTDVAIVKTIVTLAQNLNLRTIVEGVETVEQLHLLSDLGCRDIQGYYFSKPVPADSFEILLNEQSKTFESHPLTFSNKNQVIL